MERNGFHRNGATAERNGNPVVFRDQDPSLVLSRWQRIIFPLLLQLAHLIFRLITGLWYHLWRLHRDGKRLLITPANDNVRKQLRKCPAHVAFVVNETGEVDVTRLAGLVAWCLETGINNVSLYDAGGRVKRIEEQLVTSLAAQHVSSLETHRSKHVRVRNREQTSVYDLAAGRQLPDQPRNNGDQSGKSDSDFECAEVSLLSAEDGKADVSLAAASLAADVASGDLDPTSIDVEAVSSRLRTNRGMPDPDLMVRFGRTSCNMGFLPWQVRLTEIHDHPSHRHIDRGEFNSVLLRFSRCEQRFGK